MSLRAVIVMVVVSVLTGIFSGLVLFPHVGYWCLAFSAVSGLAFGKALWEWDERIGAPEWWSPWR